ncbi:nitroreductase family deazaflavin-dependent oxidoreductase [Microbacterium sp. NPDC056044]|uniref:nitroreductase family deazaflavin-dependent oxidoreductase n=1 Tax=Microbacterium sp. NPDC056044 TaxID=3345690 RepID=UPI0035DE4BF2
MPLTGIYEPSKYEFSREQAEAYESSGGAQANTLLDKPIVVLTSVGARTGRLRKTPLMRVESDGRYAVVASAGGAPSEPAWGNNLRNHPHVELQDGAVKRDYLARELAGDERETWWRIAVDAWPDYESYRTNTDRLIAVFLLEPTNP